MYTTEPRNYRILSGDGEVLYEHETCIALLEYAQRNIDLGHNWSVECLSPSPAIGWQPCTMHYFRAQCRRDRSARFIAQMHRDRN